MKKKTKTNQSSNLQLCMMLGIAVVALTWMGSAYGATVQLFQEGFETNGDDVTGDGRYTILNQHITLEQGDFNDRVENLTVGTEVSWGTLEGDWYFYVKDLNETGPGIGGTDLTGTDQGRITWNNPIDISGVGNLSLLVAMATGREEQEPNNMIAFQYRIDGGPWITFGGCRGAHQQSPTYVWFGAEILSDPSVLTIYPTVGAPRTVPSFREFEFPIYDVGDSLELRVFNASGGNHAEMGYDNLRIVGDDEVATMTVALNKDTFIEGTDGVDGGTFTVTLGAPAPAGGLTITVGDDDEGNTEADVPSSISVDAGQTEAVVNFDILDDGRFDGDELVRVTFDAPGYERTHVRFTVNNAVDQTAPDIVINEIYANPEGVDNVGELTYDANNDGKSDADDDEFVEIVNNEATAVDISGFRLFHVNGGGGVIHTFPAGTVLPAGGAAVVFGWGDPRGAFGGANAAVSTRTAFNMSAGGDTVQVLSGSGIVSEATVEGAILANNDTGTRNPDITGDFVRHTTVNESLFSPGTKVDGSPFIDYTDTATLSLAADTVAEDGGVVVGTVTVNNAAPAGGTIINLSAAHHFDPVRLTTPTKVTVPDSVTIPEGATSADFDVTGIDNSLLDGDREMDIHAGADGIMPGIVYVTVTDDEVDAETVVVNEGFGHVFQSGLDPNQNGRIEENNEDQFIEIVNAGTSDVNLHGWTVHSWRTSEPGPHLLVHRFDGTILPANGSLLLWGGSNDPDAQAAQANEFQLRSESDFGGAIHVVASEQHGVNLAVEDAQRIVLQTPDGHIENVFTWSTPNSESPESLTRAPDLTGDDDQLHLTASGLALLALSPGAMIDGTFFAGNGITSAQVLGGGANPLPPAFPDWYESDWFGFFNTTQAPWLFHNEHGFIYQDPGSVTDGTLFFYDDAMVTWWYTSRTLYPFLYAFDPPADNGGTDIDAAWLFYFEPTMTPRSFAVVTGPEIGNFLFFNP